MKRIWIFCLAWFVSITWTGIARGDANSPRQHLLMDFGWRFVLGDPAGAQQPAADDATWRHVELPHDFSIEQPFDQNAPGGGTSAYLPGGIGWYRKHFNVPAGWKGQHVTVEFDGVYQNSEVWINGHSLGTRPYGFSSFSYDLSPYLTWGGDNLLAVRADNSVMPNARYYTGSGIYRDVWLNVTGPVHVGHWGTYVTEPSVSRESATLSIRTTVVSDDATAADCQLQTLVLDSTGATVAQSQSAAHVEAGKSPEVSQEIRVARPHLWSLSEPNMYTIRSNVQRQGAVVDSFDTPVGIRSIVFDVDHGFLLNGEHVKIDGACIHQEGGAVGAAVPAGVWQRRIDLLKSMGCNAIRVSHNPASPVFLDLCDRSGMLVMDEAFDEWRSGKGQARNGYHLYFDQWSQRDLSDMIQRDRNHPSIVIWSAGNEINEQTQPQGTAVLRALVDTIHRLDPTRPVTAACDKAFAQPVGAPPDFMALLDVAGYNYVDRWLERAQTYYTEDRRAFPARKFIGTESIAIGGLRDDYRGLFADDTAAAGDRTNEPGRGGRGAAGRGAGADRANAGGRAAADQRGDVGGRTATDQRGRGAAGRGTPAGRGRGAVATNSSNRMIDVEQLWKFVGENDYVAGDFMWTGFDYLGEAFWPNKSATSGPLDTCGFPKDGYFFYQSQWTDHPVLHLFPHWNWTGHIGEIVPVTCFTNCDTVELFVNGKSYGVKGFEFPRVGMVGSYGNTAARDRERRTTSDLHLEWDVPYEPGTLKAVGTREGKSPITEEIFTTGNPAAIELSADHTSISANRRDVANITVRIVDDHKHVVPTADSDITFEVSGGGARLIGVDNGDPADHTSFQEHHRAAFHGLCLAIVQSSGTEPGAVHLVCRSKGLVEATITIDLAAAPPIPSVP